MSRTGLSEDTNLDAGHDHIRDTDRLVAVPTGQRARHDNVLHRTHRAVAALDAIYHLARRALQASILQHDINTRVGNLYFLQF